MGKNLFSALLSFLIVSFISNPAFALTTLHVTTHTDDNPGGIGDSGDLRYAINSMNQDLQTIFDDYAIVFDHPMTIQLKGILPIINNSANPVNITIGNSGSTPTVTIDGANTYSGFFIPIGTVTIQNMIFQNMLAKGGDGGDGIAGGGGGLGAGSGIYAPTNFLFGSNPAITLKNVSINNSSAVGGDGGSYIGGASTGYEGGGGGGGFCGNGGSITATGSTGGGGGGGFGGDGGNVTLSMNDANGGGGGGGGGIGSRASFGSLTNLGNGGADDSAGQDGNAYGLSILAGSGGGGHSGGSRAGGGGGGGVIGVLFGGGGGGSNGTDGLQATGNTPARGTSHRFGGSVTPSGGNGGDGAGGGGAGVVSTSPTNQVDGEAGNGGYGGGGGGGAGIGAYDTDYESKGGSGGLGGGGGAGGVNHSGSTSAVGGNSNGGGGGGGAGPTDGSSALGGSDTGNLGGGSGGNGASSVGVGIGGGGGGGGSALGAAIFIDSNLNFTLEALSGIPTNFNTSNNTTQAGNHGTGASGATDGNDGSALGNSIFLRSGSSLTFSAQDVSDLLTLGNQVAFSDDTNFGGTGTSVFVSGNGTVTYNGTTDYQGHVTVNNANFKVNGQIDSAAVSICRNSGFSSQKGKLSGTGTMTGDVYVNSGTISPEAGGTLTLGSLTLNPPSVVHIDIDAVGTSLVSVNGNASLSGTLEITLNPLATAGTYIVLTASSLYSTFNTITFTGTTPNYTLSYLPVGAPTYVQFDLIDHGTTTSGSGVSGGTKNNFFGCTIGSTDNNSTGSFAFLITLFCSTLIVLRLRSLTTVQKYRSNKS